MVPKIAGVKVLRQPRDGGGDMQTLGRNDEVILAGDEQNGYTKSCKPSDNDSAPEPKF